MIKIPFVTLIDTIDTLVIFGNYTEFRRVVQLLHQDIPNFDFDVNVSLFETTIRLLGGLLSAHLMAIDPVLNIYVSENTICKNLFHTLNFIFHCISNFILLYFSLSMGKINIIMNYWH